MLTPSESEQQPTDENNPTQQVVSDELQSNYDIKNTYSLKSIFLLIIPVLAWSFTYIVIISKAANSHPFHEVAIALAACTLLVEYKLFQCMITDEKAPTDCLDAGFNGIWKLARKCQRFDLNFTPVWLNVFFAGVWFASTSLSSVNGACANPLNAILLAVFLGILRLFFIIWFPVALIGCAIELRRVRHRPQTQLLAATSTLNSTIYIFVLWVSVLMLLPITAIFFHGNH